MDREEEAARRRSQEERQDENAKQDMEAVELGDAVVSIAGDREGNKVVVPATVTSGTPA